ncbi:Transient receptor potential cation channel subfamily A member 1 [Brachionus plicatilis]|uniref:Transient receptor potential cation channel subfamily A member 1 n=1 Tax=Brachionus plicatilis TaxID=10195 RepID=A0A3M7QCX9_BRAPC|nr:Transient receptor potential cation channel subfamily A member 1 [Brachionus plicatilis]
MYQLTIDAFRPKVIEDKKNLTPLHLACKFGFEDEAELLIDRIDRDKLFNVCMLDLPSSLPPLHLACRNKVEKFKIVKRILEKLRDEDSKLKVQSGILKSNFIDLISKKEDANRQTILEICIENNHVRLVELLLSNYSISTNQPNSVNGNYSIHLAAKNGSTEILSLLIKYNSNIIRNNLADENPLHIAALYNRFKFVREYLVSERHLLINSDYCCLRSQKKTSIDSTHLPCMCNCDGDFDLNSAQLSIRQRDKKFHTPLMRAIVSGSQLVVEELINDKYVELDSKDKDGQSIYHLCSEYNNTDILRYLLQTDFIPQEILFAKDNFENTILHTSCRTGNLEAIKLIVNKLYDSNNSLETMLYAKNYLGHTCFHIACIKGYYNIVEYFLKEKKLIQFLEHVDNNFNTSLHLATENGHSGIANLLLEFGIDPSVKNEENTTALDLSCRLGYFEISKNIITNCSDLKNQDKIQHEFPLHTACYEGAYEVVKLLLLKGVQIDKLNDENKNCLEIAIKQGHNSFFNKFVFKYQRNRKDECAHPKNVLS